MTGVRTERREGEAWAWATRGAAWLLAGVESVVEVVVVTKWVGEMKVSVDMEIVLVYVCVVRGGRGQVRNGE